MPNKSTEFVVVIQERGKKSELAGPYWQRRDAVRALPRLLEGFHFEAAVRAVAYARMKRLTWGDNKKREDRKTWEEVARAEKERGSRVVRVTETRSVV